MIKYRTHVMEKTRNLAKKQGFKYQKNTPKGE